MANNFRGKSKTSNRQQKVKNAKTYNAQAKIQQQQQKPQQQQRENKKPQIFYDCQRQTQRIFGCDSTRSAKLTSLLTDRQTQTEGLGDQVTD